MSDDRMALHDRHLVATDCCADHFVALYIGSISASPTACPSRGYRRAGTQNDRLSEVVTAIPTRWTCPRRCRDGGRSNGPSRQTSGRHRLSCRLVCFFCTGPSLRLLCRLLYIAVTIADPHIGYLYRRVVYSDCYSEEHSERCSNYCSDGFSD